MRRLHDSDREAIVAIFLQRRIEYTVADAAQLLRVNIGDVMREIEQGTIAAELRRKRRQLGGPRHALMPWSELAAAAMRKWGLHRINAALGERAPEVIPELLLLTDLSVALPEYQVRVLGALARKRGESVSECLSRTLSGMFAMMPPASIDALVPGATEAAVFPRS